MVQWCKFKKDALIEIMTPSNERKKRSAFQLGCKVSVKRCINSVTDTSETANMQQTTAST